MAKKPRLLRWARTGLGGADDYLGKDPERPRLYARVYLAPVGTGSGKWFWTIAEQGAIGSGYRPTLEDAVETAERTYAAWIRHKPVP